MHARLTAITGLTISFGGAFIGAGPWFHGLLWWPRILRSRAGFFLVAGPAFMGAAECGF